MSRAEVAAYSRRLVASLPPWWEYQDAAVPRPGDPNWQDPIDCRDIGPLSDEPANDAEGKP